ncbi:signal peptide containing protein [Theileria equi strain WA]|uniref:Signal peptide containing protein n=1 Tax=Theileria equi strain WA TaxID=1537102 RepID=L1LDP8_THEEQ|nr:signal peptide containing protein [Theileria equi strain WA]EKX73481.1 signal peptide containing protein [Theileria equi strain WA]|eukprot:XP_004832933.1 signal peptide containing protein [Theileria equi strain WA]
MKIWALFFTLNVLWLCKCRYEDEPNLNHSERSAWNSELHDTLPFSRICIDLSIPDEEVYQSIYYVYDDVPTKLIVPEINVYAGRLSNGQEAIWTAENETIHYAKVLLRNGQPELVFVKTQGLGISHEHCINKNGNRWVECSPKYHERVNALKILVRQRKNIAMDLDRNYDEGYISFHLVLMGLPFNSYVPKVGHDATKVVHNGDNIWVASSGEKCTSALFSSKGSSTLLGIDITNSSSTYSKFFEKIGGSWNEITEEEFYTKTSEINSHVDSS